MTFRSGDQPIDFGQGGLARPGDFGEEVLVDAGVLRLRTGSNVIEVDGAIGPGPAT